MADIGFHLFFFFIEPAPPEIYPLPLHAALPISRGEPERALHLAMTGGRFEKEGIRVRKDGTRFWANVVIDAIHNRSEEHTSELQSQSNLVCRLLLEKKNKFQELNPRT